MFHRAEKRAGSLQDQNAKKTQPNQRHDDKTERIGMEQTAVQRYAKSQEEMKEKASGANQNNTAPYAVRKIDTNNHNKEATMNNAQPKEDNQQESQPATPAQPQGRVDIPGQNFQRPGQATRPSYPGASYPGAQNAGSSYAAQANDRSSGPKLVIGQGITMSGEIEACDHLIVEGTIEASLKGASILDVAETGSYFGTVEIDEANIAGRFEGDITVKGRLTIEATGTIIGTVTYKELSMEAGATLDGSISPIGSQNAAKNAKTTSKSKKVSNDGGAELPFANQSA